MKFTGCHAAVSALFCGHDAAKTTKVPGFESGTSKTDDGRRQLVESSLNINNLIALLYNNNNDNNNHLSISSSVC